MHPIFASLAYPDYRKYFLGQCVSLSGSWMQQVAMSWLVYRLTGSVFLLGFVGFCTQIPSFLLSMVAGVYVDRFNKSRLLMWAQMAFMATALTLALFIFTGWIRVWHIIVFSLINGVITAVDTPARQALVADLVPHRKDLGNAIALNSAVFNGTRLIGPSLGGLLIAAVGEAWCFLINGLTFSAMILALSKIRPASAFRGARVAGVAQEIREGFDYVMSAFSIRVLLLLLACFSLLGVPYIVIMPAFVSEVLGGDSKMLGLVMSCIGAGAFVAALRLASNKSVSGLPWNLLVTGGLFGLSLMGMSLISTPWMAYPVFVMAGYSMISLLASINTLIQTLVADDKRGRVMSLYGMALMGTVPFGNLLQGVVASSIGIQHTLLVSGIACVLVALLYGRWFRGVRFEIRAQMRRSRVQTAFRAEV